MAIVAPDPATDPDGSLAVRYGYPRWIVAAYRAALGAAAAEAELEAALAAGNARPKVTMATFPGGRDGPGDARPGRTRPVVPVRLHPGAQDPADLIASGRAAVQDEASQLAAIALTRVRLAPGAPARRPRALARHVRRSRREVPTAARPGRHRPGAAPARLIAAELHPHRAALVKETLARAAAGRRRPEVVVADGTRPPWPEGVFDRVLVDARAPGSARSAAVPRPAGGRRG